MCQAPVDEDSAEVLRVINENKIGLVTQMINNKGLERAARELNMSPLRVTDMNPMTDDDDDVTVTAADAEGQKKHCHRRPRPRTSASVAPKIENTGTGVHGERPAEMLQAKDDLPVFGNVENPSRNSYGQEFGDHPHRSESVSERPRGKRVKSTKKGQEDPAMVHV